MMKIRNVNVGEMVTNVSPTVEALNQKKKKEEKEKKKPKKKALC